MIIKFSDAILKNYPDIYKYAQSNLISDFIYYLIDWNKRRSVELSKWIKNEVSNPSEAVKAVVAKIKTEDNFDMQVWQVMNWVQDFLVYKGDLTHWKANEYWATPDEILTGTSVVNNVNYGPLEGDCEDGAILNYVLCRLKGISANRLMIWCGMVQANINALSGGHACLFYKPINYPLNFSTLDWCYYPVKTKINERSSFTFVDKDILEEDRINQTKQNSCYKNTWFAFNEDFGWNYFKPRGVR